MTIHGKIEFCFFLYSVVLGWKVCNSVDMQSVLGCEPGKDSFRSLHALLGLVIVRAINHGGHVENKTHYSVSVDKFVVISENEFGKMILEG